MPTFNTNTPETTDSQEWVPFETGEYIMKIADAKIAPNTKYPNDDGTIDDQLTLRLELAEWKPEYEDAGYMKNQAVFHRLRPWYGTGARGDSKFKQFIDQLLAAGAIPQEFWIAGAEDAGNQGDLVGVTLRVFVEKYKKTLGENKGKDGNKVLTALPVKKNGHTPPAPVRTVARPPVNVNDRIANEHISLAGGEGEEEYLKNAVTLYKSGELVDPDAIVGLAQHLGKFLGGRWGRQKPELMNTQELDDLIKRMADELDPNAVLFNS